MALTGVYTGAALAYSLRNLSGYTGDVARIRRSNDNAELDFTGAEITDGTLATWMGANDAYVVTAYDQSGNSYDVTQATAANQPRIGQAGVVETKNGRPAMRFDGTNDRLLYATGVLNTADLTLISVAAAASTETFGNVISLSDTTDQSVRQFIDTRSTVKRSLLARNSTPTTYFADLDDYLVSTNLRIQEAYIDASRNMSSYANGVAGTTATHTGTITSDGIQIGAQDTGSIYLNGYISEVIAWNDDVSADRADIYEDIRSYYFDTPLIGDPTTTGSPTTSEAELTEQSSDTPLTADPTSTGAPTTSEATLDEETVLVADPSTTGAPTTAEATLTEQSNQALTADPTSTGAPTTSEATLAEGPASKVIARREILSDLGRRWRVEVYDRDTPFGIDSDGENISVRSDGFTLDYESPNDDIFEGIKASKCTTTLVINPTDTAIISMITTIAQSEEGRFYLFIKEYNEDTEEWEFYWWGQILTDLVKEPDKWPSEVDLVATDGLGLMADTNYNPTGGGLFTGLNTFGEIIAKALERVKQGSDIREDDPYIKLSNLWMNAAMPNFNRDPMLYTAIRQEAFWREDRRENAITFRPSKVSEVMDAITFGWNARIILAKGYYHIEQARQYASSAISRNVIDSDGAHVSKANEGIPKDIDQENIYTTHGGYREWAKPLKVVRKIHQHNGSDNILLPSRTYDPAVSFPYSGQPLVTEIANEPKTLKIRFAVRIKVTNRKSIQFTYPYLGMKATVRLFDGVSTNAYLAKSTMGNSMVWVPSSAGGTYGFFTNPLGAIPAGGQKDTAVIKDFETPTFTNDNYSTNSFRLQWGNYESTANVDAMFSLFYTGLTPAGAVLQNSTWPAADIAYADWHDDPYDSSFNNKLVLQYAVLGAQIIFDDTQSNEIEYVGENSVLETSNSYDFPLPIPFGDVVKHQVEPGAFRVWNGSTYVTNQNGWGYSGPISPSTHNLAFHQLGVQQAVALRTLPQDRQYFDVYGIIDPINALDYQGSRYAFIGGQFTARADRWKGYWQRIGAETSNVVTLGNTIKLPPFPPDLPAASDDSDLLAINAASGVDITQVGITSADITGGDTITTVPIVAPNHTGIKAGMAIIVKSVTDGTSWEFEVAADVADTDTSITVVSNTPLVDLPADSVIIIPDINYVDVMGQIYSGTFTGLLGWTPSLNTSSPNNTVNASRMLASGGSTNQDAVIQPKGNGALLAQLPDGTSAGGNKRGANAVDLQTVRGTNDRVASGANSFIGGGGSNKASGSNSVVAGGNTNLASNDYSTVGGGINNTASGTDATVSGGNGNQATGVQSNVAGGILNTASGSRSVISGGDGNTSSGVLATVSGGTGSTASGTASVVSGGNTNLSSGDASVISGGIDNTSSAYGSVIIGGEKNLASGLYSTVLGGAYAVANKRGMVAHAASKFSADGDNQREYYELSKTTTDDTPTILTADNAAPDSTNTIAIESGAAYAYQIMLSALCITDSTTASYISVGHVYNNAGTLSGADTIINDHNDIGLITISVNFNSTDDRLDIEVEGLSAKTIRWGATVTMRKVK